jgi:hypothetical protein
MFPTDYHSYAGLHIGFKHLEISTSSCDDLEMPTLRRENGDQRRRKEYNRKAS